MKIIEDNIFSLPRSKRMTVTQCLQHPWMTRQLPCEHDKDLSCDPPLPSRSLTLPSTPTANTNVLDDWEEYCINYDNLTNSNKRLYVKNPSYRPNSSSQFSSTHSLYKAASRQNLDLLRSRSKSREALAEKLPNSILKKPVSYSRERLSQGPYTLGASIANICSSDNLSCSLSNFDKCNLLTGGDYLYHTLKSPLDSFQSDEYDSMEKNRTTSYPAIKKTSATSDKRPSIHDMTNDEYDEWIDGFYPPKDTSHQEKLQKKQSFTRCDFKLHTEKFTPRYSTPTPSDVPTVSKHKYSKPIYKPITNTKSKKIPANLPHSERRTRANQINREEGVQKDKPCRDNKMSTPKNGTLERIVRKRSVSHVEQRIKERRERQLEKEKEESAKKVIPAIRRSNSIKEKVRRNSDAENFEAKNGSKKTKANPTTRRNSFPARRDILKPVVSKKSNEKSTPSSSVDNVKEVKVSSNKQRCDTNKTKKRFVEPPTLPTQSKERPKTLELSVGAKSSPSLKHDNQFKFPAMFSSNITSEEIENDEAYVSLENQFDEGTFSQNKTFRSNNSECSEVTPRENSEKSHLDAGFVEYMNKKKCSLTTRCSVVEKKDKSNDKNEALSRGSDTNKDYSSGTFAMVKEFKLDKEGMTRSQSSSHSDFGSMLSDLSDLSQEDHQRKPSQSDQQSPVPNTVDRLRSKSIQSFPQQTYQLVRSNSVHVESSPKACAKPYGDLNLCQGSIGRALDMFRQQSNESSCSSATSGGSINSRKSSSHWSAADGLDEIIEILQNEVEDENNSNATGFHSIKVSDFRNSRRKTSSKVSRISELEQMCSILTNSFKESESAETKKASNAELSNRKTNIPTRSKV